MFIVLDISYVIAYNNVHFLWVTVDSNHSLSDEIYSFAAVSEQLLHPNKKAPYLNWAGAYMFYKWMVLYYCSTTFKFIHKKPWIVTKRPIIAATI
jgi:hypothetical protein